MSFVSFKGLKSEILLSKLFYDVDSVKEVVSSFDGVSVEDCGSELKVVLDNSSKIFDDFRDDTLNLCSHFYVTSLFRG